MLLFSKKYCTSLYRPATTVQQHQRRRHFNHDYDAVVPPFLCVLSASLQRYFWAICASPVRIPDCRTTCSICLRASGGSDICCTWSIWGGIRAVERRVVEGTVPPIASQVRWLELTARTPSRRPCCQISSYNPVCTISSPLSWNMTLLDQLTSRHNTYTLDNYCANIGPTRVVKIFRLFCRHNPRKLSLCCCYYCY